MNKWIAGAALSLLPYVAFAADVAANAADAAPEEPTGTPWGGLILMGIITIVTVVFTVKMMSPKKKEDDKK